MKTNDKPIKRWRVIMVFIVSFIVVIAAGISFYAYRNMNYDKSIPRMIEDAGFVEKQVILPDETVVNYGEGSEGGVPLLLIHGQMVSWEDYAKVLSKLSKYYHVYAVDCHGHGKSSKDSSKYTAAAMGNDFIWFIENVIKEPAVISGHSSGGLLTAWLAANSPDNVKGIVIEDAPFFATEPERREKTYAWLDGFQTIHKFLNQSEETDYTRFYLECSYLRNFWGNGWEKIVIPAAESYMAKYPDEGLRLWFVPPTMNKAFDLTRCIQNNNGSYDLKFGNTFYDGSWFESFDQEKTLSRIQCPSVLMHTVSNYDENGVLLAAMGGDDASRAHELMPENELIDNIKSGHNIHDEKPTFFIDVMVDFLNRIDEGRGRDEGTGTLSQSEKHGKRDEGTGTLSQSEKHGIIYQSGYKCQEMHGKSVIAVLRGINKQAIFEDYEDKVPVPLSPPLPLVVPYTLQVSFDNNA